MRWVPPIVRSLRYTRHALLLSRPSCSVSRSVGLRGHPLPYPRHSRGGRVQQGGPRKVCPVREVETLDGRLGRDKRNLRRPRTLLLREQSCALLQVKTGRCDARGTYHVSTRRLVHMIVDDTSAAARRALDEIVLAFLRNQSRPVFFRLPLSWGNWQ